MSPKRIKIYRRLIGCEQEEDRKWKQMGFKPGNWAEGKRVGEKRLGCKRIGSELEVDWKQTGNVLELD